jgi:hypothetical protein
MVRVDGSPVLMVMKNYPPEFKTDAVALYESRPGATIVQIAADLGDQSGDPAELDPGGRQTHAPGQGRADRGTGRSVVGRGRARRGEQADP